MSTRNHARTRPARTKGCRDRLTQAQLKDLLWYNSETGDFFWRKSKGTARISTLAGYNKADGYRCIGINYVDYYQHKLAWLYVYGYMPKELDHKNRIKSDNRIENLREATRSQNMFNKKRWGSSGFKGTYPAGKRWSARIVVHLGSFDTREEAHAAYCAAAKKLHGEFFNPG